MSLCDTNRRKNKTIDLLSRRNIFFRLYFCFYCFNTLKFDCDVARDTPCRISSLDIDLLVGWCDDASDSIVFTYLFSLLLLLNYYGFHKYAELLSSNSHVRRLEVNTMITCFVVELFVFIQRCVLCKLTKLEFTWILNGPNVPTFIGFPDWRQTRKMYQTEKRQRIRCYLFIYLFILFLI